MCITNDGLKTGIANTCHDAMPYRATRMVNSIFPTRFKQWFILPEKLETVKYNQ